jgi:transcriptional regulator with PAS, ATPase and Fis domain
VLNDYACRRLFEEFIADTNDGFIVVDPNGIVLEINQNYCDFLGKTQEEIVGRPIQETISTTTMHEVLRSRQRGDGPNGVYLHPYAGGDTRLHVDTHAVCNRFCFFAGDGTLLGAAAQISFKERTAAMAYGLMEQELQYYKEAYQNQSAPAVGLKQIIGNSPQMEELKRKTQKIARRDFPVLITGETGTGKEMFAKAIHLESARRDKPIISINCAAIPAELLESELFGYEPGAFTGASRSGKLGRFQLAEGGTVFLDEIGDMPLPLQAKLLRVLQERELERVGGGMPVPIDVRIVAATRRDLPDMIRRGTFREDLYYRLNVINLEMIPLREHPEDIPLYISHTLERLNREYRTDILLSDAAKRRLQEYRWPGNVRELMNVITSAYASCDLLLIDEMDLPTKLLSNPRPAGARRLPDMVAEYEAAVIRDALRRHNQNIPAAARELGIDRSLLYRKIQKAGIIIKRVLEEPS